MFGYHAPVSVADVIVIAAATAAMQRVYLLVCRRRVWRANFWTDNQ